MINFPTTTKKNLKLLAAFVWYSGIIVLAIKSLILIQIALELRPNQDSIWMAVLMGLFIGILKTKFLFRKLCLRNLQRINCLENPKIWQFYRPHFFIFLLSMILLGSYLSRLAHGYYPLLIIMLIIEISIATALFGSSNCYWKRED